MNTRLPLRFVLGLVVMLVAFTSGCFGISYDMTLRNVTGETIIVTVEKQRGVFDHDTCIDRSLFKESPGRFTVVTRSGKRWDYDVTDKFYGLLDYSREYRHVAGRKVLIWFELLSDGRVIATPCTKADAPIVVLCPRGRVGSDLNGAKLLPRPLNSLHVSDSFKQRHT